MTKLFFLNYFILQWLFIRLARCGRANYDREWYGLMIGVYPLTGWSRPFKFVGRKPIFFEFFKPANIT